MDAGVWYVYMYNDEETPKNIAFSAQQTETEMSSCPNGCHGHGDCDETGQCVCFPGYRGWDCELPTCPVVCQGNGLYVRGACQCHDGWKGRECEVPRHQCEVPNCNANGVCVDGSCVCAPGYTGEHCQQEICSMGCVHGVCESQRCVCNSGWSGALCDELQCDDRCADHGYCNNGTCTCHDGWNGKHCSLDGCHNNCHNHGTCQLYQDGWRCACVDGWKGEHCQIRMELNCRDGNDNDDDGQTDCQDSDCCMSAECIDHQLCGTAPNPMDILLRKQPPSSTASFYDRMRFLMEDDSVQSYATSSSFNESQVSVIRGKVTSSDGSPLIGVRVSVKTQPLYGFTLTREQGLFDILVNGGGSVTIQFQRQPFDTTDVTVMVPWNQMITMEPVAMLLPNEPAPPHTLPCLRDIMLAASGAEGGAGGGGAGWSLRPVVLSTWQHTQLGSCPKQSTVIPESQVLQESVSIPGTDIHLVYHSSDTSGYMSTIMIQLTPAQIPAQLRIVHLHVSVEGIVFKKLFEADPNIKYKYAWDRRNAYNQKVYGIVTAKVSVGYEFESCPGIIWEIQTATMSGYDISSSEIGGWNLHIHHTYNYQEGILHKGDGTNLYLKERPRKVTTVLGTGRQRRADCRDCDGVAVDSKLLSPVALASGRDGSLYVGDFNYIRKLSANRQDVTSILELHMPEVPYKYFMTVSPLDGKLYISDYESKQVVRVKTMGAVRDLDTNMEVIVGTGEQCVPGDVERCADGQLADRSRLVYPKGVAIDKDGKMYIADGANIRLVDATGIITTYIGTQGHPTHWTPLPCDQPISIEEMKLHWPTALAINPLNDALYILDDDVVLRVTSSGKVVIVAGRPRHCPPTNSSINPLLQEDHTAPRLATEVTLVSPQHITFAPNGHLYIVESDGKHTNRIREVHTDGTITHYAGAQSPCDCQQSSCRCYAPDEVLATEILLNSPTAITVTPDNVLHVADMGNLRIHSIVWTLPQRDYNAQYQVLYPQAQELYVFNRYGQHVATKNIITNRFVYNFTYHINSYYGKLKTVTDGAGHRLQIARDYAATAEYITPPGGMGYRCNVSMDNMGQLQTFYSYADNSTTTFSYVSNTGLLEHKQTSLGEVYMYEYDKHGRLSGLVQPTGEEMDIITDIDPAAGAIARLSEAQTRVSYRRDGGLIVEYPFNMVVMMETTPHPLLTTEHQLQVKRKILLPDNLKHRLEWRYYVRRDSNSGAVMAAVTANGGAASTSSRRAGNSKPVQRVGRRMRVNGMNLLTFEYDRDTHSEMVLDKDDNVILTIRYNDAGQPVHFEPAFGLKPVDITYSSSGRIANWTQGLHTVRHEYDDRMQHLVRKTIPGEATTRYLYKTMKPAGSAISLPFQQPISVMLASGKQYVLRYDGTGNLQTVTMPGQGRHHFHALTTIDTHRRMYYAPEGTRPLIADYNGAGQPVAVTYPSTVRQVRYWYDQHSRAELEMFDWSTIRYQYYPKQGVLKSATLHNMLTSDASGQGVGDYTCALNYKLAAALVKQHTVEYNGTTGFQLWNARYTYQYDTHYRVILRETVLGDHVFRPVNYSYSAETGRLQRMKAFVFEYPRVDDDLRQETIIDDNIEIGREYNAYGRISTYWYRFNNHVAFTLEMTYDTTGRLKQYRRQTGSSDLKAYEYVYDIDGNLLEVALNAQRIWRYEYDADNNLYKIIHHGRESIVTIDNGNRVVSYNNKTTYKFDEDGFMVGRDKEMFEYNSHGLLTRAHEGSRYDVQYYYDAYDRLIARRDVIGGYLVQFFYGDIKHKTRVTHVYDHNADMVSALYYDNKGSMFAMEQEGRYFYIALDPMGTPVVVFNAMGSVVKQMTYNPLGAKLTDSSPDFSFIFGFQGGIVDHITKLVHFHRRVYDPELGRWTSADVTELMHSVARIPEDPAMLNQYQHHHIVNLPGSVVQEKYTDVTSWLSLLGYDMVSLVPHVTFSGDIQSLSSQDPPQPLPYSSHPLPDQQDLVPVTSAFQCAFERDMHNFAEISNVPLSKVIGTGGVRGARSLPAVTRGFSPYHTVFGDGIILSTGNHDNVQVNIVDSADAVMSNLATTLFNNSHVVDLQFTIHSRDTHYFVKPSLEDAHNDVKQLALDSFNAYGNLNVTIHLHHHAATSTSTKAQELLQHVDIRLHSSHTVLNLRYGTTVAQERKRVLRHAKHRAVEHAWIREREVVTRGLQTIHTWSHEQAQQLMDTGYVDGVHGEYIHDVQLYPQLADSVNNIQLVTSSNDGGQGHRTSR